MKNTFNKLTQSLFEAFKGPRTKDYEYEKKTQEYQICKERMLLLKSLIDNYPARLDGYKTTLDNLISNLENIFDKEQGNYYQFMSNVVGAHKALNEKLLNMFLRMENLKTNMKKWTENCESVDSKLALREEKRKVFDHYDEKMAELLEERNKIILKGKIPNDKDDEKYVRNVKKYQSSAKEYIEATNDAFKHICYFMDSRYDNISLSIVEFIEIEAAFYNEASYIFNFFKNTRNNIIALRQQFQPIRRDYDASNFIRGKSLLNIDIEEMMKDCTTISGVIEGKPKSSVNEMNKAPTFNQTYNQGNNNFNGTHQRANSFSNSYNPNNDYGNKNNYNNNYGNNNFNNNYNNYNNNNNYNKNNYNKNIYSKNNYNNNNSNIATNPYKKGFIDNSVPDPFADQPNNNNVALNPYGGGDNNNNNNNSKPFNPYDQGNNDGTDNPFDKPNI